MEQEQMQEAEMPQAYDDGRALAMEDENPELKKWELDPTEELTPLKEVLYGIPKQDSNGNVEIDTQTGGIIYRVLPLVTEEGAEQILNFVQAHTSKLVTLGYYTETNIGDKQYPPLLSFAKLLLLNGVHWGLPADKLDGLYHIGRDVIDSSYTRGLNGNEKVYRAKTHTSHEHKVTNETPQQDEGRRPKGLLRRMLTGNR